MIMNIPALDRILGIHKADWAESKHPRASNGQFGSGGGGKESAGAKHKRNQQARRAESAGQSTLGGGKAIQTLLGGGSALDKIGWLSTSKPKQETPKEPGWPGEVPEKKPLPADGASLNDFTESWISRSKYADKYRARPDLVNHQAIEAEWVKSLRERASEGPLSNAAIESFTEKYGEAELLRTFRGVEGKGLQNYVPKDKQMAHQQNPMMFGAPDQSKPKEPEKPAEAPEKKPEKKPFDRANEVVLERTSSPDIFNLKGDAEALGLGGVKIPAMVIDHSAKGAKELRIEVQGKTYGVKDDLKAAGFKWDPGVSVWYHPRKITGETIRCDIASTLKDMRSALEKKPAISLHLTRF